jgi:hypothetical protein
MLYTIMLIIRFILFSWWVCPIMWIFTVILTGNLQEANEMAIDIFWGDV